MMGWVLHGNIIDSKKMGEKDRAYLLGGRAKVINWW